MRPGTPSSAAIDRISAFLAREVLAAPPAGGIDPDRDLVELGLDSLAILRLVLFLETEYGAAIEGADILGEGLSTVRQIAARCARNDG